MTSFFSLPSLNRFRKSEESEGASALRTEKSNLKFKLILSGKTLNSHKDFIDRLKKRVQLKEVKEDECDFILGFCPIVSRAGTDIEAAMKRVHDISDTKPVVLVVLHHTYDTECVVPDSRKCVNRKNMIAVDCLFYEDTGLLQCLKNNESLEKTSQYLEKEQHIKLKKQEQELRRRPRVSEEKDEERNDTNVKPKKMILSNDTQEGKNTAHERNQQLNKIEIVEEIVKRNEMKKKIAKEDDEDLEYLKKMIIMSEKEKIDLEEKNRDLLGQLEEKGRKLDTQGQELQDKERQLQNMMIVVEKGKSETAKQNQQLEEKDSLLTERQTEIMEREKEIQEKDRLLTERQTEIMERDKEIQEKDRLLTERQTEIMERDKEIQEKDRLLTERQTEIEGQQWMVLEDPQIQESQAEGEEREINNVEKNKESIEKNQMIREKETVQDEQNYSDNFHKADAMLIDSK